MGDNSVYFIVIELSTFIISIV